MRYRVTMQFADRGLSTVVEEEEISTVLVIGKMMEERLGLSCQGEYVRSVVAVRWYWDTYSALITSH